MNRDRGPLLLRFGLARIPISAGTPRFDVTAPEWRGIRVGARRVLEQFLPPTLRGRGQRSALSLPGLAPAKFRLSGLVILLLLGALDGSSVRAGNWPQFLGPTCNGVAAETNLSISWPKEGPPIVWQRKVGQGFSGPAVDRGKLILFHRIGDKETVECLDARTSKP
ncbi:MAG: hypothetical protein ABI651_15535, partial [Verrucomicrobiota bacterium]